VQGPVAQSVYWLGLWVGLDNRRFSSRGRDFSLHQRIQTGSGAHRDSYPLGAQSSLKIQRPGHEAYHSPPSSSEIKNAWRFTFTAAYVSTVWCLILFVCYLITFWVSKLYTIRWYNDEWMINWKLFGRKRPWPHRGTSPTFVWRDWGSPWKSVWITDVQAEFDPSYIRIQVHSVTSRPIRSVWCLIKYRGNFPLLHTTQLLWTNQGDNMGTTNSIPGVNENIYKTFWSENVRHEYVWSRGRASRILSLGIWWS
jgi:hypothetical protein